MDNRERSGKLKDIWLGGIYYIPVVFLYLLNMVSQAVRPGVIASVFMFCVLAELIIKKQIKFTGFMDALVAAWFLYNALSVIWLVRSGMPLGVYNQEFVVSLLPAIFYLAGRSCAKPDNTGKPKRRNEAALFYRYFIYAVLILGVVGIILQLVMPRFYIDYSYKLNFVSSADADTCRVRMDSVVGSTVLGFLSAVSMLVSIPFIMERKSRLFGIISMFAGFVIAFMSNQRSAMVVAILALIYFNWLLFFTYGKADKKYFALELLLIAAAVIALLVFKRGEITEVYYRLASLPGAVGERSEQWIAAVNNMYSTWFGNGLGANGHMAIGLEDAHVVADGGLIKSYCEQGIFGFSMFLYILILSFKKGLGNIKEYCAEVGIIAAALLQSIGSNILSFQLAAPIFWFAIGRIYADENMKMGSGAKKGGSR